MRVSSTSRIRSGAVIVEAAIVLPVLLLLLFTILSGALMVFAADEVAMSSREGARFASVRGTSYAFNTKNPAATEESIREYVLSRVVTLNPDRLTCTTTWHSSNRPGAYVSVEVRYTWPGLWPFGEREFVNRSTMLISY